MSYTMGSQMADGYEPPSHNLRMPHYHRASCHGAIGELQCGFPPGPSIADEPRITEAERDRLLAAMNDRSVTVLPNDQGIKFSYRNRPDGPWLRAIRGVCYIVVIITCLCLLLTMFDVWYALSQLRHAVEIWQDGVTSPGPFGN